jgi:hypothetical protein
VATADPTWWADVRPLLQNRCGSCHTEGGSTQFPVQRYEDVAPWAPVIALTTAERTMPPFQAAACCNRWLDDPSLTEDEIATLAVWAEAGAPEGDPATAVEPPAPVGGLSRVDRTLGMTEDYQPDPAPGSHDDFRCFAIPWEGASGWITGLQPRPGNRALVHHLLLSSVAPIDAAEILKLDERDPGPGYDCKAGLGSVPRSTPIGGSLVGGDFPRGIGIRMEAGSVLVLNLHYSVPDGLADTTDRTEIDLRVDDEAVEAKSMVVLNPLWLAGPAMRIPAGARDVPVWYSYQPRLLTGGVPVNLESVTPHMHAWARSMRVLVEHRDGSTDCLLEIPDWQFGWERPYWFVEPVPFAEDDAIYIECRFDNPTDEPFAWGEDNQDMCAAFVAFSDVP